MLSDNRITHWTWNVGTPFEELLAFCLANTKGYAVTTEVPEVPEAFRAYAESIVCGGYHYEVDHWYYWVSTLGGPQQGGYGVPNLRLTEGWMANFPHCHGWDGLTVSLHVQVPEAGGELVEFAEDQWTVRQEIKPHLGLTTIVKDHVWHGVRDVIGDTPRISIMAGAYPYPVEDAYCRCETPPIKERKPPP